MGREIERKFLVQGDQWRSGERTKYRQGYLSTDKHRTVRIRLAGDKACITIKGLTQDNARPEYEYHIPRQDAQNMLENLCLRPLIEKWRYRIEYGRHTWEVDEFTGENEGLVLAEVELEDQRASFERPPWISKEVSQDPRYFNMNLIENPYTKW